MVSSWKMACKARQYMNYIAYIISLFISHNITLCFYVLFRCTYNTFYLSSTLHMNVVHKVILKFEISYYISQLYASSFYFLQPGDGYEYSRNM